MDSPLVVVVHSDLLSRVALVRAIEVTATRYSVMGYGTASEALDGLSNRRARVGVAALTLPDLDGLALLAQIRHRGLATRLIALANRRDACTEYFLNHGGIDAVIEPTEVDEDAAAGIVCAVAEGRQIRPPEPRDYRRPGASIFEKLTPRELEIFTLIGGGTSDREAAARLGVSARTVHIHRHRIMWKLNVRNRESLMWQAMASGAVRVTATGFVLPGLACARLRRRMTDDPHEVTGHIRTRLKVRPR